MTTFANSEDPDELQHNAALFVLKVKMISGSDEKLRVFLL